MSRPLSALGQIAARLELAIDKLTEHCDGESWDAEHEVRDEIAKLWEAIAATEPRMLDPTKLADVPVDAGAFEYEPGMVTTDAELDAAIIAAKKDPR
jgi:hypothetical protein